MTSPNPPKVGSPFKRDHSPPAAKGNEGVGRPSQLKQSVALRTRRESIWELANPQLRELTVYEPGKPIEETARELGVEPGAIVKLASNENPLGPSPKAIQAMHDALENAHLYPDGSGLYLRKAIATKLGVAPDNIILGNGSNEVIEFLGHAFLNPGDDVITSQHAFIVYKLLATSFGARAIEVPAPDFQQDLDRMLDAITPKTRLIVMSSSRAIRYGESPENSSRIPGDGPTSGV